MSVVTGQAQLNTSITILQLLLPRLYRYMKNHKYTSRHVQYIFHLHKMTIWLTIVVGARIYTMCVYIYVGMR